MRHVYIYRVVLIIYRGIDHISRGVYYIFCAVFIYIARVYIFRAVFIYIARCLLYPFFIFLLLNFFLNEENTIILYSFINYKNKLSSQMCPSAT